MADRGLAIITGASSGIGEAFARAWAYRGQDLLLVARRADRLRTIAAQLAEQADIAVHVCATDLSKPQGCDDVAAMIERLGPVQTLINNAGFGSYGPLHQLPIERELQMVDLNVRALVALTGLVLGPMVCRKQGLIVQIASTTSFQAVPYMATYGATKAFVLHFAEAIAAEVADSNVRVIAVCPGHTPTEFQANSGVHRRPTRTPSQNPQDVVAETLMAIDRSETSVVVTGWPNRVIAKVPRLLPRKWMTRVVAKGFRPRPATE